MIILEVLDLTLLKKSESIKQIDNFVYLDLEITPGAAKTGIKGFNPWRQRILINIHSPAKSGQANKELIKFLSNIFKIHQGQIRIVKGHLSEMKTLLVSGISKDQIQKKLVEVTNENL